METNRIDEIIKRFAAGNADEATLQELEQLIEAGAVSLEQLEELHRLHQSVDQLSLPVPSAKLDASMRALWQPSPSAEKPVKSNVISFSWTYLAAAASLLLAGFFAGYNLKPTKSVDDVSLLAQEVKSLKEMMLINLLEKESATERLKAVSLTEEIDQPSQKVTGALFETLNHDASVNVRLAALEALRHYAKSPAVRTKLVSSIAQQDSPLVQVALADLMVTLQEKSSVKELEKVAAGKNTPKEVKQRIRESIQVLI